MLSRLIWGIDLRAPVNPKTGKVIIPDIADEEATWTEGFVSNARVFDVNFEPRSNRHAAIITRSFEDSQAEWQALGLATDER